MWCRNSINADSHSLHLQAPTAACGRKQQWYMLAAKTSIEEWHILSGHTRRYIWHELVERLVLNTAHLAQKSDALLLRQWSDASWHKTVRRRQTEINAANWLKFPNIALIVRQSVLLRPLKSHHGLHCSCTHRRQRSPLTFWTCSSIERPYKYYDIAARSTLCLLRKKNKNINCSIWASTNDANFHSFTNGKSLCR